MEYREISRNSYRKWKIKKKSQKQQQSYIWNYPSLGWQNSKVGQFIQSYGLKTNKKLYSDQTGKNNNRFD